MMSSVVKHLEDLTGKETRVVIGMISGTSADSIDVAVCRVAGAGVPRADRPGASVELLHYGEHPYEADVRRQILDVQGLNVAAIAELNVRVGEHFARAALETLQAAGLSPSDVDLVGSHGQTVYHHSSIPGARRATLQVGDGDVIAERLGVAVICRLPRPRHRGGGRGGPDLAPGRHDPLRSSRREGRGRC